MFDENICRTCLTVQDKLISITNNVDDETRVLDCFNNSMRITMKEYDELPQMICFTCFDQILEVNKFYQKCIESENHFKQKIVKMIKNRKLNNEESQTKLIFVDIDDSDDIDISSSRYTTVAENKNEKFQCSICNEGFRYEKNLKLHIDFVHNISDLKQNQSNGKFMCNLCQYSFKFETNFNRHMDRHREFRKILNKKPTKCRHPDCNETFIGIGAMEVHFSKNHEKILCQVCGLVFLKELYEGHRTQHKDTIKKMLRNYKCNFCDKTYRTKRDLMHHERMHKNERPFVCQYCKKSFTQRSVLNTHLTLHTGKNVDCPQCNKKFSRKGFLAVHMRSHTQERPYQCEICFRRYKQKCHLKCHFLNTHSSDRPFQCKVCDKTFKSKESLRSHSYHHEKPYKCPACNLETGGAFWFRKHLKRAHNITGDIKPYRRDVEHVN